MDFRIRGFEDAFGLLDLLIMANNTGVEIFAEHWFYVGPVLIEPLKPLRDLYAVPRNFLNSDLSKHEYLSKFSCSIQESM